MTYSSQGQSSPGHPSEREQNEGGKTKGFFSPDGKPLITEQSYAKTAEAFDSALAFAWIHRKQLLQAGFVAGIIEILLTYTRYFLQLSQQQFFLLLMIGVGSISWLMTYAGLYCLSVFKKETHKPLALAVKAFQSMPKTVLSYIVLVAIAMALFSFPPLLIFAIFGLWAPAFCVAELTALPLKEVDEGPDDDYDDEVVYRKVIHFRFFQGRPLWDLGFARSIAFVGQNFWLSLQFCLFVWALAVIPTGVMLLFAGYYPSFSSLMLEVLAENMLQALLLGVGMVSFLILLPQEARAELGLGTAQELQSMISRDRVPSFLQIQSKKYPLLAVFLLGLASTSLNWSWIQHQQSMPATVQVALQSAQVTKDRLIVTLDLNDKDQLYRWLNPSSLKLEILKPDGSPVVQAPGSQGASPSLEGQTIGQAVLSQAASEVSEQSQTTSAPLDEKKKEESLLPAERVMPFALDGASLEEGNFTPYSKPLRLVLYFSRPKEESGKFALYHTSMFGLGEPILQGEYSAGAASGAGSSSSEGAGGENGKST